MFDIKKAKRNDTAEFKFRRLSLNADKPITLHVRHLGATNKAYVDAVFTRSHADKSGHEKLLAGRERDLADIASFSVVSWEGVNRGGEVAPCTPENVLAFLKFTIDNGYDDEINDLVAFVVTLANFREPIVEGADLGKG